MDGIIDICELVETAANGRMPRPALRKIDEAWYEERTLGYKRAYAAMAAGTTAERVLRIWPVDTAQVGGYVVEDGRQWRIDIVQVITNDDGLRMLDLTLARAGDNYDVLSED